MSLNGLDTTEVQEAYTTALAELGGWFLLKYASRNEVGLLGHGTGGIVEMREAIAQYEEASPLYGFLKYRRRNVIIKYLPEDCSRLVQARVAVHFTAVCDKFAPHNTTFAITTAKELKDTKLSAACSLHTASSSTSSSTSSLRRRRLIEIAEEEEEEQQAAKRQSILREEDHLSAKDAPPPPAPVVLNSDLANSPEASKFAGSAEPPPFLGAERPSSPGDQYETRRLSSQLSPAELLTYASYNKPKVKIAPRPSADLAGRPRTSGSTGAINRPVSSMPAGFKLLSRGSRRGRDTSKLASEYDHSKEEHNTVPTDPVPASATHPKDVALSPDPTDTLDTLRPQTSSGRPTTSSGLSVRSLAATIGTTTVKRNSVTPEMVRLKKAMKLREKKKLTAQPSLPTSTVDATERSQLEEPSDAASVAGLSVAGSTDDRPTSSGNLSVTAPHANSADSAIDVGSFAVDQASVDTQTTDSHPDSHPTSPLAPSFGVGESTKASSLSESTDETAQASPDMKTEPDGAEADAAAIPMIAEPSRDSLSTIHADTSESASADAKRAAQRAQIEPICTDVAGKAPTRADAHASDDDDLDELHSATVEEARPITVSKSPINPALPSPGLPKPHTEADGDMSHAGNTTRSASNPIRAPLLAPADSAASVRSVSTGSTFLPKQSQANASQASAAAAAAKKATVGSSISQRIKALEKLSEAKRAAAPDAAPTQRPSSTFFAVRKVSGRELARSPSVIDHTATQEKGPSPSDSLESSPEFPRVVTRDRSGSMASRLSMFEGGSAPIGRPESVQVKARIVRDATQPFPKMTDLRGDASEFGAGELKQSPLVVAHQKASLPRRAVTSYGELPSLEVTEASSRRESIQERRMSKEQRRCQSRDGSDMGDDDADGTRPRRRSSLSIVKDFIKDKRMGGRSPSTDNLAGPASAMSLPAGSRSPSRPPSVHAPGSLTRRLSISSRRSSTSKDREPNTPGQAGPLSPSLMTETSVSGDDSRPSTSDLNKAAGAANKGRAGRFMRRLSSSFSSGRKATTPAMSPTVREEEESYISAPPSAALQASIVSYIGDVNVQFPDNLLWKRRTMCLDSQGFVILSTATVASISGGDRGAGVKRYHLSDLRMPYIPEMELQELPNSVCLDLVEGSGLQIACEDRTSQLSALQILQDAHRSHTSFGQ